MVLRGLLQNVGASFAMYYINEFMALAGVAAPGPPRLLRVRHLAMQPQPVGC